MLVSVHWNILLIFTQDRCIVCAERTTGLEIGLDTPDGTWNLASFRLETVLVSVQHWCMVCARRTIGSEIMLDAPDRTLGDESQVKARPIWR